MRKLFLAAIAALATLFPALALAQTVIPQSQPGSLATITTDTVTLPILGTQWGTARFKVLTAGTATATAQYSTDSGFNYVPAPYAKRISTVSANPTVQPITNTTLTTGDIWEVPIPANATNFQLVCGASGTTTTVLLFTGIAYIPGAPVIAVLYDVTSGTNSALDTGILDVSGWSAVSALHIPSGGTASTGFNCNEVDDSGTSNNIFNLGPTGTTYINLGAGTNVSTSVATGTQIPTTAALLLPRRVRYTEAAIAAETVHLRVLARR